MTEKKIWQEYRTWLSFFFFFSLIFISLPSATIIFNYHIFWYSFFYFTTIIVNIIIIFIMSFMLQRRTKISIFLKSKIDIWTLSLLSVLNKQSAEQVRPVIHFLVGSADPVGRGGCRCGWRTRGGGG